MENPLATTYTRISGPDFFDVFLQPQHALASQAKPRPSRPGRAKTKGGKYSYTPFSTLGPMGPLGPRPLRPQDPWVQDLKPFGSLGGPLGPSTLGPWGPQAPWAQALGPRSLGPLCPHQEVFFYTRTRKSCFFARGVDDEKFKHLEIDFLGDQY